MSNQAQTWKPKHYPTQSWDGDTHQMNGFTGYVDEPQPIILPAIVHAVQDSSTPPGGRSIVICLDGTGDKFDNDNSNVVNFVACLKKDDPSQVTYYQTGIGTYDGQGMKNGITAAVDMAVGSGLGIHIKDAYRFLMQNYHEGDRICLLGFSRGAYTVRCLAGMLHKVGLLPAHNRAQVEFAYRFYKDDTKAGWEMSAGFKKTFCTDVTVHFLGVWDCVASVGFIPRKLPFSKTPTRSIRYFRHAMALDEHRAKFKVLQWQHDDPNIKQNEVDKTPKGRLNASKQQQKSTLQKIGSWFTSDDQEKKGPSEAEKDGKMLLKRASTLKSLSLRKDEKQRQHEKKFERQDHASHKHIDTDVLEVWFAGAHADVGGGAVLNHERHMLSRIPLRWMLRQCFECDTGILFSTAALAEAGIDVPTVYPVYKTLGRPIVGPSPAHVERYEARALPPLSRRSTALGVDDSQIRKQSGEKHDQKDKEFLPFYHKHDKEMDDKSSIASSEIEDHLLPEQVEDHFDALAPINDQLAMAKSWWILELFWPVKVRVQRRDSEVWEKVVRLNMGRYRGIRELEPRIHWTVDVRTQEKGYKVQNEVPEGVYWKVAC